MENKRYYWLKLKNDFFQNARIKKLRKIAGGDTYTIIYLKLQLLSLENEGKLYYEGIEPTFEEEIALKLDEELDDVKITIQYLLSSNLMELSNEEYILQETIECIGSETASTIRSRKSRNNQKMLQCNTNATKCNGEIDIDIEKDIELDIDIYNNNKNLFKKQKFGKFNNILLTEQQYENLSNDFGKEKLDSQIEKLDEYIQMKGAKYKDFNLLIRKSFRENWFNYNNNNKKEEESGGRPLVKQEDGSFLLM